MVNNTISFVKASLRDVETGHDFWHSYRVRNNCLLLLKTEKANPLICELAALLHDIADPKFHDGDEEKGPQTAAEFLRSLSADENVITEVEYIIRNISFAGGLKNLSVKSPELMVVQDADRLDAMGAIGIARAFNYGGYKKNVMYNPSEAPTTYISVEEYRNSDSSTIAHFYEKLLLLKDLMNTPTGRIMAEQRHKFMEDYLDQFFHEWGEKK
jgi:uncharacterized protein